MLSSTASQPIDATVSADATVSQMKVDPMAVVFYKVGLTENTVHEVNQTGSYEISLKHRPGFRFDKPKTHSWDYRHQRHLSSLKGGGFYRSEGEADREVYKHMLRIEGFEQRDGAYYESPAIARARTKVPAGRVTRRCCRHGARKLECAASASWPAAC